jgi:CRP-like cAMP-binding protein
LEAHSLLRAKLERLVPLDEEDRRRIAELPMTLRDVGSSHCLVREGRTADECCLLVSGFACRQKLAANGGRQIVSFHLPGDLLDLQHLLLERADHNVETITEASVAWIPQAELWKLSQERPALCAALWRDSLIDASIFREWVLNVGRRDARTRVAHMLCEFAIRCERAGLGSVQSFELPMTQEHIADATGLTSVHVNRMLRSLELVGALSRTRREIRIRDWDAMRRIADFDAAYLHAA